MPINKNISVYEGDDSIIALPFSQDLTGYKIELQVREEKSSRYAKIVAIGSYSSGQITIGLKSADTLGSETDRAMFYDIKTTSPTGSTLTAYAGMFTIDARTSDIAQTKIIESKGVGIQINGVDQGDVDILSIDKGLVAVVDKQAKKVSISTIESRIAPTLALHFAGIYDTLNDLNDAIGKPSDNQQAIVLSPSEKYFHAVGGQWVELAPVGSYHPLYIGVFDSVADVNTAEPNAPDDSLAIINKAFYLKISGQWEQLPHTDLPSLNSRLTDVESKEYTNASDVSLLKSEVSTAKNQIDALHTADGVLQNNINQKISGIHLEDFDNNAYDDITGITFEGAEIVHVDQGDAHVRVSPKITVSDGQLPDSHSVIGNAIVVNGGAKVRVDQNDKDVIHIDLPTQALDSGVEISKDGSVIGTVKKLDIGGDLEATKKGDSVTLSVSLPSGGSLNIADSQLSVGSANKLEFMTGKLLEDGTGGVQYTPAITCSNQGGDYAQIQAHTINAIPPLKFEKSYSAPSNPSEGEVMITLDHAAFEPMHAPSYLAYLSEDTEVVGKVHAGEKGHHDGALWMDNVVCPAGAFIQMDLNKKSIGIQESDGLDPLASGGNDYLIIFRAGLKGNAPNDGFVRAYLYNTSVNPYDPTGYLIDKNGQPIAFERNYKKGDKLGVIEAAGIVNVTALQEFSCHIVDNFIDDNLLLTDRTEGATGLMVQALTSTSKTGNALQQFELDTWQRIVFSSHYLGSKIGSIDWISHLEQKEAVVPANVGITMADGLHLQNVTPIKFSISGGVITISDDGSNVCDFNFGKIFSAEVSQMLKGKDVTVSVSLIDKDDAWRIGLMKWSGKPDEFSDQIYTGRLNDSIIFSSGWSEVGSSFITEDAVSGEHTFTHLFTIPDDCSNFAIVIYPEVAQQPATLKISRFDVDNDSPFVGYVMKVPELVGERHLIYSDQHKTFYQDNQKYSALRYTIGDHEIPMPVGIAGKGAADINLNNSVNKINGSQAKGGEGAIEFKNNGQAVIETTLRIWSEQPIGTQSTVKFWYAKVIGTGDDATYQKIDKSEASFIVDGGAKAAEYPMPVFKLDVAAGDMIALRTSADKVDAAFLQSTSPSAPMVYTTIDFNELSNP